MCVPFIFWSMSSLWSFTQNRPEQQNIHILHACDVQWVQRHKPKWYCISFFTLQRRPRLLWMQTLFFFYTRRLWKALQPPLQTHTAHWDVNVFTVAGELGAVKENNTSVQCVKKILENNISPTCIEGQMSVTCKRLYFNDGSVWLHFSAAWDLSFNLSSSWWDSVSGGGPNKSMPRVTGDQLVPKRESWGRLALLDLWAAVCSD